jgi:hypothetical protein
MHCEDAMANGAGPILAVMCLATFMAILDTSLVNLGLKTHQGLITELKSHHSSCRRCHDTGRLPTSNPPATMYCKTFP